MGIKIYLKNYWNSIVLLWMLGLFSSCTQYIVYEELPIDKGSTNKPYVKMNVKYQDKIYAAVVEEWLAHSIFLRFSKDCSSEKMTLKKELYVGLRKEILEVDDITYRLLKDTIKAFVNPQQRIDFDSSRIKEGLTLFKLKKCLDVDFSHDEEKYLISLLFEDGIYVVRDCETGHLFLAN